MTPTYDELLAEWRRAQAQQQKFERAWRRVEARFRRADPSWPFPPPGGPKAPKKRKPTPEEFGEAPFCGGVA